MLFRFNYWLLTVCVFTSLIVPELKSQEVGDERLSSPENFNRHLTRLSPKLIEATVAVMVPPGSGSGVIVSPEGLIMTAAHVTVTPGKSLIVILSDGRRLPATALGVDHSTDGALIQINSQGPFPFRPYAREKNYKVDDWVIATGHPGGPIKNRKSPVRLGRITKDGTGGGFTDPITTSTTIISGDSGGPLFNLDGEVIGINSNIGRNYLRNNHVPLPCMLEQWQPMLDGETIGNSQMQRALSSPPDENRSFFDEPYAELRERFYELLTNHKSDPEAAAILSQPRLLDPHHMQMLLDRWYPSGQLPPRPKAEQGDTATEGLEPKTKPRKQRAWLGVVPELPVSEMVIVQSVVPGSPAANADLKPGDKIVQINGKVIGSLADLNAQLTELEVGNPIQIVLGDNREIRIQPEVRFERMLFPAPVAGLIQMQIVDDGSEQKEESAEIGLLSDLANAIRDDNEASVVAIQSNQETISMATVISGEGELLAKASELEGVTDVLTSRQGDVELLAIDEQSDLALLKTSPKGLKPVTWTETSPKVASLVFTTGIRKPLAGVVTQRMRSNPPTGYENAQSSDAPSVWMGTVYEVGSVEPVVAQVRLSSPADVAGILEGDKIKAIQGTKVESVADLSSALEKYFVGDKVKLEISRSGETKKISLILSRAPDDLFVYSKASAARDQKLATTSRWGGELNKRRNDFPVCIYHDIIISPEECGTPLFDIEGNAIGINIARSFRHRSLALPTREVLSRIERLRKLAINN